MNNWKRTALFFVSALACGTMGANGQQPGGTQTTRPQVVAKPVALNWRNIKWPTLDYARTSVPGGAALYTVSSSSTQKFQITVAFDTGVFNIPRDKRVAAEAMMDLMLEGGAGKNSYDEISHILQENALDMETNYSRSSGKLFVKISGLNQDFDVAFNLLRDVVLAPRWDADALDLWKQENEERFDSIMDAGSSGKQRYFSEQEIVKMALGENHYFASALKRYSPSEVAKVNWDDVKSIYKKLINRAGLNVVLAGKFSKEQQGKVEKWIGDIPRQTPLSLSWIPERSAMASAQKVRVVVIQKPDMPQANIGLRYYYPTMGRLNRIERYQVTLLGEVFNNSNGNLGTDRFSRALRTESGIAYSPGAYFESNTLYPNTNMGAWRMGFQADSKRIVEGLRLAKKTWDTFVKEGVTAEEFENARTSKINSTLTTETTIFDKANDLLETLLIGEVPNPNQTESYLAELENQTNVSEANQFLKKFETLAAIPVAVIFGNLPDADLAELKKDPSLDVVKVIPFADIVADLKKQ